MALTDILNDAISRGLKSEVIVDSFYKADALINSLYDKPMCSISGGSDSDVMLDLIHKVDRDKKVTYVWFDTGLEYGATKRHLEYLENRYDIQIIREKASVPIPLSVKRYGEPFVSKYASTMIERLQNNNFKWEDRPYEELIKEYPNCVSAIKWWCNKAADNLPKNKLSFSRYCINFNDGLKDFMILHPPSFKISAKCCDYAKKNVNKEIVKRGGYDVSIVGVRKFEGGIRQVAYEGCHTRSTREVDQYRPLFWYRVGDKREYEKLFGVVHSDCYTKWHFSRTGCVCCPYGKDLGMELNRTQKYEPNMYKAVCNIFKNSYEYTEKYKHYKIDLWRERHGYKKVFTEE